MASFTCSAQQRSRRSASAPVKSFGMCCTINTGTGRSADNIGSITSSAEGPPVDTPITITSITAAAAPLLAMRCSLPLRAEIVGATHGFCIGHVGPEAAVGGPIALLRDGDKVTIDAVAGTIDVALSDTELAERRRAWTARQNGYQSGTLWKYAQTVGDAENGAVTHPGARAETHVYADL